MIKIKELDMYFNFLKILTHKCAILMTKLSKGLYDRLIHEDD